MRALIKTSLLSLAVFLAYPSCGQGASQDQSFFKRHAEGWFSYRDEAIAQEEEAQEAREPNHSKTTQSLPKKLNAEEMATKHVEAYKREIEGKRNLALAAPTYENVRDYMRIQQDMAEKARYFGQTWQQVVLNEPDLNFERKYPTAQYARHIQDDEQQKRKIETIRGLSQEYGLFYFFKGGCPACEGFSPLVKLFAQKYSWEVMAVSVDGSSNSFFPNTKLNNGMAEELGIKAVPALIAYHTATGNLVPISYAMTSLDRLEDNINVLTNPNHRSE